MRQRRRRSSMVQSWGPAWMPKRIRSVYTKSAAEAHCGSAARAPEAMARLRHLDPRHVRPGQPFLDVDLRTDPPCDVGEVEQSLQVQASPVDLETSHQVPPEVR